MRIGILGAGSVGTTLAAGFAAAGHRARAGHRDEFAEVAADADVVVLAVAGTAALDALHLAGHDNLAGAVLWDVTNPLDFSAGFPPRLTVCNDDSLGEMVQRTVPRARVVKALSTVTASVMTDPGRLSGPHHLPICGDDADAKAVVLSLLSDLGWSADSVVDLGGIDAARGMEAYLLLWVRLMGALGTPEFNTAFVLNTAFVR